MRQHRPPTLLLARTTERQLTWAATKCCIQSPCCVGLAGCVVPTGSVAAATLNATTEVSACDRKLDCAHRHLPLRLHRHRSRIIRRRNKTSSTTQPKAEILSKACVGCPRMRMCCLALILLRLHAHTATTRTPGRQQELVRKLAHLRKMTSHGDTITKTDAVADYLLEEADMETLQVV